jgi:hypothetical protein
MMESDRVVLCSPKGSPDPARSAHRGAHTKSWVTRRGRCIAITRLRVRALVAGEMRLPAFSPRQNSCSPDRIDEQEAITRQRIGSIRTSVGRQSGGEVVASGECSVERRYA